MFTFVARGVLRLRRQGTNMVGARRRRACRRGGTRKLRHSGGIRALQDRDARRKFRDLRVHVGLVVATSRRGCGDRRLKGRRDPARQRERHTQSLRPLRSPGTKGSIFYFSPNAAGGSYFILPGNVAVLSEVPSGLVAVGPSAVATTGSSHSISVSVRGRGSKARARASPAAPRHFT